MSLVIDSKDDFRKNQSVQLTINTEFHSNRSYFRSFCFHYDF